MLSVDNVIWVIWFVFIMQFGFYWHNWYLFRKARDVEGVEMMLSKLMIPIIGINISTVLLFVI